MQRSRFNDHQRHALYIGRWQPFHSGHKFIIDRAIAAGKKVCVAIRDTEISDNNPYTVQQREAMIRRVYGDKVRIITIPDIESVNIGRNVGYEVNFIEPPKDIAAISGTNVRLGRETRVPPEVAEYVMLLRSTLWLTGLPCAGKTTLAKRLKEELDNRGYNCRHLDGDNVRGGLNENLGFSPEDRRENLRRIGHVAKLFNDCNTPVVASFVSPTDELRGIPRGIIGKDNFKLVYVQCSAETCAKRDVKGMWAKAKTGEIPQFTGVSAPFDEPGDANMVIDTEHQDLETCVSQILEELKV